MSRYKVDKDPAHPLPTLPSSLLKVALHDLESAENSPQYSINMNDWHTSSKYNDDQKCGVCFAGSVMALSLNAKPARSYCFTDFGNSNIARFMFLNEVRNGYVTVSRLMNGAKDFDFKITPYEHSPAEFKKSIRRLITRLQRKSL